VGQAPDGGHHMKVDKCKGHFYEDSQGMNQNVEYNFYILSLGGLGIEFFIAAYP